MDYYVSKSGKDTNAGTSAAPFKTIAKGVAKAVAGDRVVVRAGTYQELVRLTKGGTATAPIQLVAYSGETVIIDGTRTAANTDLITVTGNYVAIRGFTITAATRTGVSVWGAQNVTIAGNTITNCVRGGIWVGHDSRELSRQHVIEDNIVHQTCLENSARIWSGGWPRAIAVDMSDNSIVRRNRVYQNYGEGIGSLSSYGVRILENVVYDNYSVGIYLDNAPWTSVHGNRLFHTGKTQFYRKGRPAVSVLIANENAAYLLPSNNITVTWNTIAGLEGPRYDGSYGVGGGLINGTLTPNTQLAASVVDATWL